MWIKRTALFFMVALFQFVAPRQIMSQPPKLPRISREEMINAAKRLAEHVWVCRDENRDALCVPGHTYTSDWKAGQLVTGIPYDWGGMDDDERFDAKLSKGQAAGSHQKDGDTDCTAGIDCSGFVSYCWGQREKYSTKNIGCISVRPRYNWFTDMKPGDALIKPGSHIVLFVEYRSDGNPIVYEASGSKCRVVLNTWGTWSSLNGYYPIEYRMRGN